MTFPTADQYRAGHNWAGNVAYRSRGLVAPRSLDDLAEVVRGADRVKALGTRHCFSRVADTSGIHVSTAALGVPTRIDPDRRVVRTGGGVRYGDLAVDLQRAGWALPNLASLPHISIAGAVATGTHGSGDRNHSLAAAVAGLDVMTADGAVVSLRRGDPDFAGAVVSLGALGIVTEVELDIVPAFEVAQTVYERLPLGAVLDDLEAVTSLAYSTSMFTTWRDPDVIDQLWLKRRTGAEGPAPDSVLGARPATRTVHPLPGVSAQFCTAQLGEPGPWLDRLPHFRLEFTPSHGDELQSEYLVPRRHAADAIATVRALAPRIAPLLQVCELRTIAADGLWLSGAFETDAVGIHFTWIADQRAVEQFLPALERALAPFAARPHWGKLFDAGHLAPVDLFPRWRDFLALRYRFDPRGVFGNAYLDAVTDASGR